MTQEQLKPAKITDIIFRMDDYLSAMREMEKEEVIRFVELLKNYIGSYFENNTTEEIELKLMFVELVDMAYLKVVNLDMRDGNTNLYFGIVVRRLFLGFELKNIRAFFILDNSLRDDRFIMVTELISSMGFSTIFPYSVDELQYGIDYTSLPNLDYKSVEKKIDESKELKRHIFYVEKDESIDYLKEVLAIAEEYQSEYVCIFRNTAPDGKSKATWLTGSFGDSLD